jgi:hypothetical protein
LLTLLSELTTTSRYAQSGTRVAGGISCGNLGCLRQRDVTPGRSYVHSPIHKRTVCVPSRPSEGRIDKLELPAFEDVDLRLINRDGLTKSTCSNQRIKNGATRTPAGGHIWSGSIIVVSGGQGRYGVTSGKHYQVSLIYHTAWDTYCLHYRRFRAKLQSSMDSGPMS